MRNSILLLAVLCSPLAGAITNPVEDYLALRIGEPEQNQRLLAIPCDLDRDGTKDYLISNGMSLGEKFPYAEWIFYRGISAGGYEKFDHAIAESNESEPIVFVPYRAELVEVPGTGVYGFTRVREMVDEEIPQIDEVRPRSIFRWAFYFSGGQMRKKLLMKTNDRAIYEPWFEFKPSELTLDVYRAEADLLRQGKSGQLAMVQPIRDQKSVNGKNALPPVADAAGNRPWGWIVAGALILIGVVVNLFRAARKSRG